MCRPVRPDPFFCLLSTLFPSAFGSSSGFCPCIALPHAGLFIRGEVMMLQEFVHNVIAVIKE
jgi:hypothetical protein